jgi:hypothetical protein
MKLMLIAVVTISLGISSFLMTGKPSVQASPPNQEAVVQGFIATKTAVASDAGKGAPPPEELYLPGVKVILKDLINHVDSEGVFTDLSGRFTAKISGKTRFQVCWEARGFVPGCTEPRSIGAKFLSVDTLFINIARKDRGIALFGRVTLADGSSPRTHEPIANVNAFARIALTDSRGTPIYETFVNNYDYYLFPEVPVNKPLQVRIREEKYDHSQPLQLGNPGLHAQRLDLTILNTPPHIEPIAAVDSSGVRVANAVGGSTISLTARASDADGDKVRFVWLATSGELSSTTDPATKWTLAKGTQDHSITLIAYDSRGGYTKSSVNLPSNPIGPEFSGTVSGTDTPTLGGAEVEINGKTTVTDSRGYFRLAVADTQRFVMNIRKTGYALASDVYYSSVIGGRWQLAKAAGFLVDTTKPIKLTQERSLRDCPGLPSDHLNWAAVPALTVPQYQDGKGHVIPVTKQVRSLPGLPRDLTAPAALRTANLTYRGAKDSTYGVAKGGSSRQSCGPGIQVQIPPNSLVDSGGKAPAGKITVQLSTVDLQTPNQMPGNYTVFRPGNQVGVMHSYGAGTVEAYSGNAKYNLKPGAKATLVIPVDQSQLKAGGPLPPTLPLLTYNEKTGGWDQTGIAKLKTINGTKAYVGTIHHFTAYNADDIKTDQSCVVIQNQNMPVSYDLDVTIPTTGGAAPIFRHFPGAIGGNNETVLINLPKLTNIVITPIRTSDPNPNLNSLPIGIFVVNTGAPQNPAWPIVPGGRINEPVGPPYDGACSTTVVLQDLGLNYFTGPGTNGAFLHGLYSFAAVNLTETDDAFPADVSTTLRDAVRQASVDYRTHVDPRGLRPSLDCFKVVNRMPLKPGEGTCPQLTGSGFTPQPALTESTAIYANTVDLGFGREMHCVHDPATGNSACFVSNYDQAPYTGPGSGVSDITKAQHAVDGVTAGSLPDATVAMEFSQIEDNGAPGSPVVDSDPELVVKFYVYTYHVGAVDHPEGVPADAADLDGLGARPVPQLCMVCHGGTIPNPIGATISSNSINPGPPASHGVHTPVFDSRDHVKLGAKFLPFDLRSFSYAAADADLVGPYHNFSKLHQQAAFLALNQVATVSPPPDPASLSSNVIQDLNTAWYPAATQQEAVVVPNWNSDGVHQDGYGSVVARSCRTCHVTNASFNLRFERPTAAPAGSEGGVSASSGLEGNMPAIQQRVCKQHVMPHARRTHDLFWTSINPSQPAHLQIYGDTIGNGWLRPADPGFDPALICGAFQAGGGPPSPTTAFTPVSAIFSGSGGCTSCHNAANAAPGSAFNVAGLDLTGVGAYTRLVNQPSTEHPSTNRITPGAPNNSYLLLKLLGHQGGLPGAYQAPGAPNGGGAMPLGCGSPPCLSAGDIATITNWISLGALP